MKVRRETAQGIRLMTKKTLFAVAVMLILIKGAAVFA